MSPKQSFMVCSCYDLGGYWSQQLVLLYYSHLAKPHRRGPQLAPCYLLSAAPERLSAPTEPPITGSTGFTVNL